MSAEIIKKVLKELSCGNNYGEKITVVAATKTRTPQEINEAISFGITDIGENRVDEFCGKFSFVNTERRHFIGHLQTNKVKYILGKTHLIHSLDRMALAEELSKRSAAKQLTTNVLMQINIGQEETKGGFLVGESEEALIKILAMPGIKVKGLMAMLPHSDDNVLLEKLCRQMRAQYEEFKKNVADFEYLSVGMSADYKIAVQNGSNMVRLGSLLFGERNYYKKD